MILSSILKTRPLLNGLYPDTHPKEKILAFESASVSCKDVLPPMVGWRVPWNSPLPDADLRFIKEVIGLKECSLLGYRTTKAKGIWNMSLGYNICKYTMGVAALLFIDAKNFASLKRNV